MLCQTKVNKKNSRGNIISSSLDHEIAWLDVVMDVVLVM